MRLSSRLYKKRLFPSVLRIALIASQCLRDAACSPFKHICYLTSPKNSSSALPFERVDVKLCSHIILGFATVSPRYSIDLAPLGGEQALTAFAALRRRNPKIKLMISVGGGAGDRNFKEMVAKTARRYRFIDSARSALEAAGLDGLDLDWEFPRIFDAVPFARLIKEMSSQFRKTADRPLILSVAVPAPSLLVVGGYRVRLMARFVDFVNLMTYDLNTYKWYTPWVDHNSPLYARAGDPPYFNTLNVESSAELWVMLGMPNSKIMVGIPTYGLSWVLRNPEFWDVGSLAIGRHKYGGGYVNYPQVCSLLKKGAAREYDPEAKVPFLHKGTLWISYDDHNSVALKASWTRRSGYGGTMTFSLNSDDWDGTCGNGSFPLQRAIMKYSSSEGHE